MQVHPSQISPSENFDIFFFLRNPNDTSTYYCRAVIRDLKTGQELVTTDLDQSAAEPHLFIKTLQAPPDPVGMGRNIVAIATLYTDSGYTTKSGDYEEQEQYFLIKPAQISGGGGGIDYRTMRDMIQEVVSAEIKTIPKPAAPRPLPDMPFDALFGAIGALQREINRIPKEQLDLSHIGAQLKRIHDTIAALPAPKETDIRPVLTAIEAIVQDIGDMRTERDFADSELKDSLHSTLAATGLDMKREIESAVVEAIQNQEIQIPAPRVVNKGAPSPIDISHLMA